MNYYTSDSHFQHDRIMEFCSESRPFKSVEEMTEALVNAWNSVVTDKDTVYHLGDFSFGRGSTFEIAESIFKRLNGHKNLMIGNHESLGRKLPWESQMHYREIRETGDTKVVLMHYPLEDWNGRFHGAYHFHGHVHSTPSKQFRYVRNRIDVGVDNVGIKPLSFAEIKKICDERTS